MSGQIAPVPIEPEPDTPCDCANPADGCTCDACSCEDCTCSTCSHGA